ncbi:hypothetical protein EYF80_059173 [Liparis tanakae]|uniref:Uncharacterized protein n=1 Tax=Liparis tanakae TaxID=230148 RepID=A0A4Z2EQM4_9TELE|nr:hypothetical protein EYF80_059173 [Liparis tanakae]
MPKPPSISRHGDRVFFFFLQPPTARPFITTPPDAASSGRFQSSNQEGKSRIPEGVTANGQTVTTRSNGRTRDLKSSVTKDPDQNTEEL